jgi:hypothetical protein
MVRQLRYKQHPLLSPEPNLFSESGFCSFVKSVSLLETVKMLRSFGTGEVTFSSFVACKGMSDNLSPKGKATKYAKT